MNEIIQAAIQSRQKHFDIGRPMRVSEGFKEANIAHDLTWAFRSAGYFVFPEFPYLGGSIDALVMKNDELILCEWKRCYSGTFSAIAGQTQRMIDFDPHKKLPLHGFNERMWQKRCLWVCDLWDGATRNWWFGLTTNPVVQCPFDAAWDRGEHTFFGLEWEHYRWVWAYRSETELGVY